MIIVTHQYVKFNPLWMTHYGIQIVVQLIILLMIQIIFQRNYNIFIAFSNVFQKNGIEHHLTCSYTLEQNGAIEHKHRHINKMRLTILIAGSLPIKF